jgi:RimJ/RimL family protein N-acetyltransferase
MATVDKPNTASIKVLEKLGMSLLEERLINGSPILFYVLASGDYCTRDAGGFAN